MTRQAAWSAVLGLLLGLSPLRAQSQQSAADVLTAGVRAYQNLDFDLAAALLQRALAQLSGAGLSAERARALSYLAAAHLFRGRRDSATATFRQLVRLDPRFRSDPLVFPPEVTTLFEEVRRATKVVAIEVAPDQVVRGEAAPLRARLIASSFHTIDVVLHRPDGMVLRTLYGGPIGDSLDVQWDGLDAAARPPDAGRLWLQVSSRATTAGQPVRLVQVPLDVRPLPADTLPSPSPLAPSALLPERAAGGPGVSVLLGGLGLTGAVVALPSVISAHGDATPARFAIAAAIGVSTLVGFVRGRPGRPITENIRANQARREVWAREAARVAAENARRRRDLNLLVHSSGVVVMEAEGP